MTRIGFAYNQKPEPNVGLVSAISSEPRSDEEPPSIDDAYAEWEEGHDLGALFADLPERQREVLELRYLRGLSPEQIASELGIKRNAVDQALHNGHRKLEETLGA